MKRQAGPRGQALVEFAMVIPIFVLLLVGTFDLGHVVWANDALSNASREAARFAIVHGGSSSTACPVGPAAESAIVPAAGPDCRYPSPSRQAVKDEASRWLIGVGRGVTISVCYGLVSSCANDVDAPGATNARGTPVTVAVRATIGLSAPALLGMGPIGLGASTTMIVNH
jgi:TadE-like protein